MRLSHKPYRSIDLNNNDLYLALQEIVFLFFRHPENRTSQRLTQAG